MKQHHRMNSKDKNVRREYELANSGNSNILLFSKCSSRG